MEEIIALEQEYTKLVQERRDLFKRIDDNRQEINEIIKRKTEAINDYHKKQKVSGMS